MRNLFENINSYPMQRFQFSSEYRIYCTVIHFEVQFNATFDISIIERLKALSTSIKVLEIFICHNLSEMFKSNLLDIRSVRLDIIVMKTSKNKL